MCGNNYIFWTLLIALVIVFSITELNGNNSRCGCGCDNNDCGCC